MLALQRCIGQSLLLLLPSGEQIRIQYVRQKGSKIVVGIDAPKDVTVIRPEAASPDQWRKHPNGSELADRLRTGGR